MNITITYESIDRYRLTRRFKTVAGANRFATKWVGKYPDIAAGYYAVSQDGVGKITASGISLNDLFGVAEAVPYGDD